MEKRAPWSLWSSNRGGLPASLPLGTGILNEDIHGFFFFFVGTALLRYDSHTIYVTHLERTAQWFLVYRVGISRFTVARMKNNTGIHK